MNSLVRLAKLPKMVTVGQRCLKTSTIRMMSSDNKISLQNFDPENYRVPLRPVTMEDSMEPYGSWKVAYEAERKRANFAVIRGILCLATTLTIFYYSGALDGLWMPNLDNIMEETEPFNFDKEGRVSV